MSTSKDKKTVKAKGKTTDQKLFVTHVPRSGVKTSTKDVSYLIHEGIRRVLKRHGPSKRWTPFSKLRQTLGYVDLDQKTADPSTDTDMAMLGSLVSMNTVYEFRLVPNVNSVSNIPSVAGVIAGFQSVDPSGGGTWTASEWATLITLFSEVKFSMFEIVMWPVNSKSTALGTATLGNGLAVSSVLSTVAAAPTTMHAVLDNADSVIYPFQNDTTKTPFRHKIVGTDISWAIVTTPNPGSYAGCPGSIQYFGDGFIAAQPLLLYTLVGYYKFRSRI